MPANVSNDLIWEIARPYSSYLVKRRTAGGVTFSSEPLNVNGVYTKSASGFANNTAVGVISTGKGIRLLRKSAKNGANKPAKAVIVSDFKHGKTSRKIAHAVSKNTVGHRDDLLEAAVHKASALSRARKPKKVYVATSRR